MPIIAITVAHNGKIGAMTCVCTEKEYEAYKMSGQINEYNVSASFAKEYLEKLGFNETIIEALEDNSKVQISDVKFFWRHETVVTIQQIKELLNLCKLDFHDFVDAYAEKLKSM